ISAIRKVTGLPIHDTLMTTIAGKALRQFGRVPEVGDQIDVDGLVLTVIAMDGLRIARIRLERNDFPEAAEDEAP
ncbi:MAG: transporter associated domain-containing protein, partial [Gammaproteobacteria bacterium]